MGLVLGGMAIGLPVAFAFLGANLVGAFIFFGGVTGLATLVPEIVEATASFTFVPIPLFLLMGEILLQTGVAFRAIEAIDRLIARVPGRLPVVAIVGGTVFSSLSGSTVANTAMLGSVMLPDMLRRGYSEDIAMGPIMAVGGVAMLVPPSALAVLLASLANISVSQLLIAGIVPGLMMSALFVVYVIGRCVLEPGIAPRDDVQQMPFRERIMPFLAYVVPLSGIFAVVVGTIFLGWASPSESAALGCVASAIAAAAYGCFSRAALAKALRETGKVTTMILLIIAGSMTFSQILAVSGATDGLLAATNSLELSKLGAVLLMLALLLFLGAFMDQVSMLLLTLPFFLPLATSLDVDMLWLGVLFLIAMEVSLLTPPFGLLLFVMRGVAPSTITMESVIRAAVPFVVIELAVMATLIALPELGTWLPRLVQ
ncbi:MAG: TRAP transporter large permease subunit [Burkholderiaceae bacterium]|nr:TRAP transporter large permease subunit [Burkholderiaceae bacterium]